MSANITSRLYWYQALMSGIELFSQKISVDQMADFAFEFTNETLTLQSSALFIKEGCASTYI